MIGHCLAVDMLRGLITGSVLVETFDSNLSWR
jgi:hypothetical protein